jgi:hypothetical protein
VESSRRRARMHPCVPRVIQPTVYDECVNSRQVERTLDTNMNIILCLLGFARRFVGFGEGVCREMRVSTSYIVLVPWQWRGNKTAVACCNKRIRNVAMGQKTQPRDVSNSNEAPYRRT